MKILSIRGRNLASLAGEFQVDFRSEPLASAGLFAICGPTGAGKSTLLDALCLALYDATPRLARAQARSAQLPDTAEGSVSQNDPRNLLRRGTAEGEASVEFLGNDGQGYRARWSVRRARNKAHGRLQASEMALETLDGNPIGSQLKTEVKDLIVQKVGLNFEQFTRAVLLAQNEFFTFLKAGDDERAELLQTLTGTDLFEALSRRAFERFKEEQALSQRLQDQLSGQQPLTETERQAQQLQRDTAAQAAGAVEKRKGELEAQLRWHEDVSRARAAVQQAQTDLEKAQVEDKAATSRKQHLQQVEAVQALRPAQVELSRLETEVGQVQGLKVENERRLQQARSAEQNAQASVSHAQSHLSQAEEAQNHWQPRLQQAREKDGAIATQEPVTHQARLALNTAQEHLKESQSSTQKAEKQHRSLEQALQQHQQWLAQHTHFAALAQDWGRWDSLLQQASQALADEGHWAQQLQQRQGELPQQQQALDQATTALSAAEANVQQKQLAWDEAQTTLSQFDSDALAHQRQALEAEKNRLQQAQQHWQQVTEQRQKQQQLQQSSAELAQNLTQIQARLTQALAQQPPALAAREQAEKSWRLLLTACGDNVENLRAELKPDHACPVCGSTDHPYAQADARLHEGLARLEQEWQAHVQVVAALEKALSADQALLRQQQKEQDKILAQQQTVQQALSQTESIWNEQAPTLALAPQDDPAHSLAQGLQINQSAVLALATQEQALRTAAKARDQAQTALDKARGQQTLAKDKAQTAQATLVQTQQSLSSASENHAAATQRLQPLLAQLDAAEFNGPNSTNWRESWQRDPEIFRQTRQRDAQDWRQHQAAADDTQQKLAQQVIQVQATQTALAQAQTQADAAQTALAAAEAALLNLQRQRAELLAACPWPDVKTAEEALAQGVKTARSTLEQAQAGARDAATQVAAQSQALQLQTERLDALRQHTEVASQTLTQALLDFNQQQGCNLDRTTLGELLALDALWQQNERHALQALSDNLTRCGSVLQERQTRYEQLAQACPTELDAQAVAALLAETKGEWEEGKRQLAGLDAALAQDDARRLAAAALLEQIQEQDARTALWARMNELIGSAEGKKFRNFAQQLTLDVLLDYANLHLKDLARRYRLQRIAESLALLVVDQDMGNETRSVHSLSGGESFLVSLALALGLASLSSHRVRVESLFIDEGFGSLDADTLAVAMDALDRLQARGRKVGVISHVSEMTERIATRIEVKRSNGGSSRVEVRG